MARHLTDQTDNDLHEMLDEAKDEVFNLRFQSIIGQLDNNSLLKQKKKEVARILTELRMREIAQAEQIEVLTAASSPASSSPAASSTASSNTADNTDISEADDD